MAKDTYASLYAVHHNLIHELLAIWHIAHNSSVAACGTFSKPTAESNRPVLSFSICASAPGCSVMPLQVALDTSWTRMPMQASSLRGTAGMPRASTISWVMRPSSGQKSKSRTCSSTRKSQQEPSCAASEQGSILHGRHDLQSWPGRQEWRRHRMVSNSHDASLAAQLVYDSACTQ